MNVIIFALTLCVITAIISAPSMRAEMIAVMRVGRRVLVAMLSVAIATGYLLAQLHAQAPTQTPATSTPVTPVTTPCAPLRHEVDYASPYILDPLPPGPPRDVGSDPASGVLQDRVRVLDERARDRRR